MVDRYVVIDKVSGRSGAELIRSYLQARGIHCELSQETAGQVYGLGVGSLGSVEILVLSKQQKKAQEALKEYHKAKHSYPPAGQWLFREKMDWKRVLRLIGAAIFLLFSLLNFYMAAIYIDMAGGRGGLIVAGLLCLVISASLARSRRLSKN